MKTFIIDAIIIDPDEVSLNCYINANSEEEALNFLNSNYNVINIIKIGYVE
jgi:hypothetical protein